MGTQCACQKIESEEEILSRILNNMKLREIDTKSAYFEFLRCIYEVDFKIDFFLFSEYITKIIGTNIYYKLPQANYFQNLRKRSDNPLANVKAIAIIVILYSSGDEETKINFILDYYFFFYQKLNEKNVKEFISYIVDSQSSYCFISFPEIYSFETIQVFKHIYSKERRNLLVNKIYELFVSRKSKHQEDNKLLIKNSCSKNKNFINPNDDKKIKLIPLNSGKKKQGSKKKSENLQGYSRYKNTLKRKDKNDDLALQQNFITPNSDSGLVTSDLSKENRQEILSKKLFSEKETIKEKFKKMNRKLDPETLMMNSLVVNEDLESSSLKVAETPCLNSDSNQIYINNTVNLEGKNSMTEMSNNININNENLMSNNNLLNLPDKASNNYSYDHESAKFISDPIKTPEKLNEEIFINIHCRKASDKLVNLDDNEISFRVKNSSENNIIIQENNSNLENNSTQSLCHSNDNKIDKIIGDEIIHIIPEKNMNNKNIILNGNAIENTINLTLDQNNLIARERASLYLNDANSIVYEKYNKGLADKMFKDNENIDIYQKNPLANLNNNVKTAESLNKQPKLSLINYKGKAKFIYDVDENTLKKLKQNNIKLKIFREFLKLSFQFFNGDTIRNWLYDNYLKEKQAEV